MAVPSISTSEPAPPPHRLALRAAGPLSGAVQVPGDKSISHRALILGSLAVGETVVDGLLESEDVRATAAALRQMGARIERDGACWRIGGVGVGSLLQPEAALDMGNSGTSTRLLMGLVATHPVSATFLGDASLSRRPMARVIEPLSAMGARFSPEGRDRLPLTVEGSAPGLPLSYRLPVASAQVKSAILLAALNTPGVTTVLEPVPTRDHSERMLAGFGARIEVGTAPDGARMIRVTGEADLRPQQMVVPGDPSSAAFPIVAAAIVPGSDIRVLNVGINPTRTGLFTALDAMGADLRLENERLAGGEPVADIRVRYRPLRAVELPPEIVPLMVDEYPILFVAAALAGGRMTMRGLSELRVKESDRLKVMAEGLKAVGVAVDELEDGLAIQGSAGEPLAGGAMVASELDHRIAMSFAVLGLAARRPVTVDDARPIATSFPSFVDLMTALGAELLAPA